MFSDKQEFKALFLEKLEVLCGKRFQESTKRDHFYVLGMMIREYVSSSWIKTNETYRSYAQKQVFYLSIEFLPGKLLRQNLLNLGIEDMVSEGLRDFGINLGELEEVEPDAGLGNGGLGRLAACFLDSLASLNLPGHGYGIRYKHGLFEQKFANGYQVELPDHWLRNGNVWEVRRADLAVQIPFWGKVESYNENGRLKFRHLQAEMITAVPFDVPVVGYKTETVNTLRLWSAEPSPYPIQGDLLKYKKETESVSEFLYPDDTHDEGKILRLKQQYFLVAASLRSIISTYKETQFGLLEFDQHVSIHINDTHPVLAIPEFMRILIDEENLTWEDAWGITVKTFSYTNHTTLSEALEKWPIRLFQPLLPRIFMIVNEINERFCKMIWDKYPYDWDRIEKMAIIAHGEIKMAHLAIEGSHSINGVAKLHTEILKKREMNLFYELDPWKFNSKTNGITHRRWLLKANHKLSDLITESIGDSWISEPNHLIRLEKFKEDSSVLERLSSIKKQNKKQLADLILKQTGVIIDPSSIFDVQIKRLHAYKRQLLNILHIMHLYNRIIEEPGFDMYPRTFIFGAKASPGYYYAKKIIKLINTVADKINRDSRVKGKLKVIFLENYRVSLAEKIFPAAEVSEQISTASKEASGTGNMKFMMNGALTIGTLDGANVEIKERVGEDNLFVFGMTAEEVLEYQRNGGYHSMEYYHHDRRIKQVIDQLLSDFYPDVDDEFEAIYDSLLVQNDQYFVLRDFESYLKTQELVGNTYKDEQAWNRKSLVNIAHSGYFSSDRTIMEYAKEIWKIGKVSKTV